MNKRRALKFAFSVCAAICLPIAPIGLLYHDGDVLGMFIIRPLWAAAGAGTDPVLTVIFQILVLALAMVLVACAIGAAVAWLILIGAVLAVYLFGKGVLWLAALSPAGAVVACVGVIGLIAAILYKYRDPLAEFTARAIMVAASAADLVLGRDLRSDTAVGVFWLGSLLICGGVGILLVLVGRDVHRRVPEVEHLITTTLAQLTKPPMPSRAPAPNQLTVIAPVGQWSELIYVGDQIPSWFRTTGRFLVKVNEGEVYPSVAKKARRPGIRTIRFKAAGEQPVPVFLTGAGLSIVAGREAPIIPPPEQSIVEQQVPHINHNPLDAAGGKSSEEAQDQKPPDAAYRVGGGVSQPAVLSKVDPVYSDEARQAQLSGKVVLQVIVDVDGKAKAIKLVKGLGSGLDEKAIEAVQKWKFSPGMKNGQPVPVYATIETNFHAGSQVKMFDPREQFNEDFKRMTK